MMMTTMMMIRNTIALMALISVDVEHFLLLNLLVSILHVTLGHYVVELSIEK